MANNKTHLCSHTDKNMLPLDFDSNLAASPVTIILMIKNTLIIFI